MFKLLHKIINEAEEAAADAQAQVKESERLSRPLIDDIKAIKRRNHIYESTLQAIIAAR